MLPIRSFHNGLWEILRVTKELTEHYILPPINSAAFLLPLGWTYLLVTWVCGVRVSLKLQQNINLKIDGEKIT